MKIKFYALVSDCIEKGVEYGYRRAFKHTDSPSEAAIFQCVHDAIMNELSEYVDWEFD